MTDKLPANTLAEQVMARLSADIRGGRLAPGVRLPTEQSLRSELGVSRTVVREAVATLASRGLVESRPRFRPGGRRPGGGSGRGRLPRSSLLVDIGKIGRCLVLVAATMWRCRDAQVPHSYPPGPTSCARSSHSL
ncbi:MAG: FadR family transcriptional regulator [Reyranella sp.]|nr:FadR family transcriptional regulator [Reyranella sp.]